MDYQLAEDRVVRFDTHVAMQHYSTNPANVKVENDTYIFTPLHNVSLAWVKPEHVSKLQQVKASGCKCGGGGKPKFFLASLINVHLWSGKDRDGN